MSLIDVIQHYWAIILFVGGVFASWVRYEAKISQNSKDIESNEKRLTALEQATDKFREEIKVDIQEIKTTMSFIRDAIKDMKDNFNKK